MDALNKIKEAFALLISEFGCRLIDEKLTKSIAVAIYRNHYVQVECAGSDGFFHAQVRRLIAGEPATYDDEDNSIGFEDIAILESNHNYNHFDYFAGGSSNGLDIVLKNAVNLFRRNPELFTTAHWINAERLRYLKDEDFRKTYGWIPDKNKKSFIETVELISADLLRAKGFKKEIDSRQLAPYDPERILEHVVYSRGRNLLKISVKDWRDDYTVYYLEYNGELLKEVDTSQFPTSEEAANILKQEIQKITVLSE